MIRSSSPRGFTLIEMLTVMLIIAILAGIVLGINGLVQTKAARARADGEIKAISLAAESFRVDNGAYPRNEATDLLDPSDAKSGNAASTVYQKASLQLYQALSGDVNNNGKFDDGDGKSYASDFFKPAVLNASKDGNGKITLVNFIKDPFDNSYGYSTIGAAAEEEFVEKLRKDPKATRPASKGYNPTFDLWSTGGSVSETAIQAKWVKNW